MEHLRRHAVINNLEVVEELLPNRRRFNIDINPFTLTNDLFKKNSCQ